MKKGIEIVGIIEPVGGHGGMDYYDYGLSLGIANHGTKVRYYTCNKTTIREYVDVETFYAFGNIWNKRILGKVFLFIKGYFSSFRDIRSKKGDVVHMHFFEFRLVELIVLLLTKYFRLKSVVTVHDVNSFDKKSNSVIEKMCYSLINGIIVHNKPSLDEIMKKVANNKAISVIPHGNYLPFIEPIDFIEKKKDECFEILFFGQIKDVKGVDILLQAMSILVSKKIKCRLKIVGKPWKTDIAKYDSMVETLKLQEHVSTDYRYVPDEEVAQLYGIADLIVLPYREIYQSGVLLLTMSYKKPVLCSDLTPFTDIIKHGFNGFIFENGNPTDLAEKIIEIVNKRSELSEVITNATKLINSTYDWSNIGKRTITFYEEVL